RFQFAQDGNFALSADVTSPTQDGLPLSVSLAAIVDSAGPRIECMHIDAPSIADDAYMIQLAPSTVTFPVHISDAFVVQSATIAGAPATLNTSTGNYEAAVPIGPGT